MCIEDLTALTARGPFLCALRFSAREGAKGRRRIAQGCRLSALPPEADIGSVILMSAKCQTATYAMHQIIAYSITSSARVSSDGGTSRPSAFAVLRLMTSSYLVAVCTGRSAGFSPFSIRST
jgi:hypothetical protein